MADVTVETAARLHFGFCNLSLAHERLYGGLGMALSAPRLRVTARPADRVEAPVDTPVERYTRRAVELLSVPGARVRVRSDLPRHRGLGSGTQLALATATAVGRAHGRRPDVRDLAPALGRGGRSGVGVATFEAGGFVLDAGHPTAQFTADPPATGEWTVPATAARHDPPADWRVLLVVPDVDPGRSGDDEDAGMRAAVDGADAATGDRIAGVVLRQVLPAVAEGDVDRFGAAVETVGRLNGAWYADQQGGVYRPPVGAVVAHLSDARAVAGAGQSSWGPTAFGLTDAARADAAREAGEGALSAAGIEGTVRIVEPRTRGATVRPGDGG
jgi:beta-ribofuranosylaminobenzene 5'-phosphate synthase